MHTNFWSVNLKGRDHLENLGTDVKVMLNEMEHIPSKICLNNKMIQRTNNFTYLGYKLPFQGETNEPQKFTKYKKPMGIINAVLKPTLVQKHTRIRLYKTLARPVLCYGSETRTIRKGDSNRLTACEMKFMRRAAGYTKWNQKRKEDILTELKIEPMVDYIKQYQESCSSHVNRMDTGRFPKAILRYRPKGKRSIGRPMKRRRENSRP
jgi:hypothetical protein